MHSFITLMTLNDIRHDVVHTLTVQLTKSNLIFSLVGARFLLNFIIQFKIKYDAMEFD